MPKSFRGRGWRIDVADARTWKPKLKQRPRLIFCDPPFNIGQKYAEHDDMMTELDSYMVRWLIRMNLIGWDKGGCVIAIHVPWQLTGTVKYWMPSDWKQFNELIIHYRFGQCGRSNWIDGHCHCLLFRLDNDHRWNPDAVLVPSDRATTYGDKRINETERGGERLPCDVWGIPSDGPYWGRVSGTSAERWRKKSGALVDHPNQLPEVYLARLIKAYTDPGDLVIDPFVGSGTTGVVAVALGRSFRGCEIGEQTAASAAKRMKKGAVRV